VDDLGGCWFHVVSIQCRVRQAPGQMSRVLTQNSQIPT
jgi:hypothetical protein